MSYLDSVKASALLHEGERLSLYKDSVGKLTIGVGHNIQDRGISQAVSRLMLDEDVTQADVDARALIPSFGTLTDARKAVLAEMSFAMGKPTFSQFKGLFAVVAAKDWPGAAAHILSSQWATQVGKEPGQRADVLASRMRVG